MEDSDSVGKLNNPETMAQIITLVLADGRRVSFTGKAAITDDDRVVEIIASMPRPLPPGMVWDAIYPEGKESKS